MNIKILSIVVLVAVVVGGLYWWNKTEPQRMARPNPNFVAPEVEAPDEEDVKKAIEVVGSSSSTPNQTVPSLEEIEAAAKQR